jgi:hypothetical protein
MSAATITIRVTAKGFRAQVLLTWDTFPHMRPCLCRGGLFPGRGGGQAPLGPREHMPSVGAGGLVWPDLCIPGERTLALPTSGLGPCHLCPECVHSERVNRWMVCLISMAESRLRAFSPLHLRAMRSFFVRLGGNKTYLPLKGSAPGQGKRPRQSCQDTGKRRGCHPTSASCSFWQQSRVCFLTR